jgi:antitoxin CcdA
MEPIVPAAQSRKPTNVSLDMALLSEARRLGINVSRACEQGLVARIADERARRWRAENAEAIAASNAFVDEKGLPLAGLRRF